ncbi:MAG: hypothetical protein LBV40_00280 [Methanomicrobiales archaeon]|nr:hypothetical protein [Methanomicrobiales archaeon]
MNQREVLIIYCMGCLLLCSLFTPALGADELMYSASVGTSPILDQQYTGNTDSGESFLVTKEGGVLAMIQQLKGISPDANKNSAEVADIIEQLDSDSLAAKIQNFDGTAVKLDANGNYIPQFPSKMYAQGIVGTSFHASGVEGYSDGTITSSYSMSDSTRVAGYISQYVKQYHYTSGIDTCADGTC